ncbi:MAG: N-6 DNA methylase [Anaerolineaceae bacterium]|nr:N-6 DNA methylase [Anaerolineaceae bacterium]
MRKGKSTEPTGADGVLERMRQALQELGYTDLRSPYRLSGFAGLEGIEDTAALVAFDQGDPVVLCHPAPSGQVDNEAIQKDAQFKAGSVGLDQIARYVWVSDGSFDYYFDMAKESAVQALPLQENWRGEAREAISTTRRRRIQREAAEFRRGDYLDLQNRFNQLHEEIYKRRAGVGTTNEAIDEVGKVIFLKIHTERHPNDPLLEGPGRGRPLAQIFRADYIRQNKAQAVDEIAAAFKEISRHPDYQMPDLANGGTHSIFPPDEPFRINDPGVLAYAVSIFEGVQLGVDADHDPDRVAEDLLGWAFNALLRGKYLSSGGLATYLTRKEIVDCMVRMAFHDIGPEALWQGWHGQPDDKPEFLAGDICCGTGSFVVGSLAQMKRLVLDYDLRTPKHRLTWLEKLKAYSLFGADASPSSITKAHINLLAYGASHHRLLRVQDSITDPIIDRLIGKFDLLVTNPPFGAGKYDDEPGLTKMRGEGPGSDGLELGWKWTPGNKARTRKPLEKADPAALFIDRNLQLLKPGGRLLIVVPDSILSNSGDQHIREYLIGVKDSETGQFLGGKAVIKAVVSLPTEAFAISGTGAKTSFLYLHKKRHPGEEQGAIFMAVAEHVGYLKKGNVEVPDPAGNDLVSIAEAYERGHL